MSENSQSEFQISRVTSPNNMKNKFAESENKTFFSSFSRQFFQLKIHHDLAKCCSNLIWNIKSFAYFPN